MKNMLDIVNVETSVIHSALLSGLVLRGHGGTAAVSDAVGDLVPLVCCWYVGSSYSLLLLCGSGFALFSFAPVGPALWCRVPWVRRLCVFPRFGNYDGALA